MYVDSRKGTRVYVSNSDVRRFRAQWPYPGIHRNARFWFKFQTNGDLVELWCSHRYEDGPAIVALSDDALRFCLRFKAYLPDAHGHRERLAVS